VLANRLLGRTLRAVYDEMREGLTCKRGGTLQERLLFRTHARLKPFYRPLVPHCQSSPLSRSCLTQYGNLPYESRSQARLAAGTIPNTRQCCVRASWTWVSQ